jgi:hypothetical protein
MDQVVNLKHKLLLNIFLVALTSLYHVHCFIGHRDNDLSSQVNGDGKDHQISEQPLVNH